LIEEEKETVEIYCCCIH